MEKASPLAANLPSLLFATSIITTNTEPVFIRRDFGDPAMPEGKKGRRRRSSSLIYHEPPETMEQLSDQSALPNLNANWVNAKGELCFLCNAEAVLVHLLA